MRLFPTQGKAERSAGLVLLRLAVPGGRIAWRLWLWNRGGFRPADPLINPGSHPAICLYVMLGHEHCIAEIPAGLPFAGGVVRGPLVHRSGR